MELYRKAGSAGLLCPCTPEAYGGPGADFRYMCVVDEELGHALMASVEETKIRLSTEDSAVTGLSYVEPELRASTERVAFEEKLSDRLASLNEAIDSRAVVSTGC